MLAAVARVSLSLITSSLTYRPRSFPATGRRIDSEIGVGKNISLDSAESLLNVAPNSFANLSTRSGSIAGNGFKNSSSSAFVDSILKYCYERQNNIEKVWQMAKVASLRFRGGINIRMVT